LQNWRRNEEGGGALVLRRRPFGVSADAVRTNQLFLHPRGFELKKPLVAKIAELLQNSLPRSC